MRPFGLCAWALVVACLAGAGGRSYGQVPRLLTENGIRNPAFSQYKDLLVSPTTGAYRPSPGTSETGFEERDVAFGEGALTNGDASYAHARTPTPYAHWRDTATARLTFDFRRAYAVSRVRVNLNIRPPLHGVGAMRLLASMDGQDFRPVAAVPAARDGWNEASLLEDLRWLRVEFDATPGVRFITCSEVEVWGRPVVAASKKAEATIVIARDVPEVARFAAAELQSYAARLCDQRLPIVYEDAMPQGRRIFVGRSAATRQRGIREDFDPEAFVIKRAGADLALVGNDEDRPRNNGIPFDPATSRKGSLFAVYAFLESFCGVRWFWPGDSGEVTPRLDALPFPDADVHEKPDMAWRHFWYVGRDLTPRVLNEELPLWYMRNRFGIAFGAPSSFAHSWTGYLDGNASFREHPEWYALVGGKRTPFLTDEAGKALDRGSQVCTSNHEVVAQFVRKLRQHDPAARTVVSISPNDGLGFCECPNCRALDRPDLYGPDEGHDGLVLSDRLVRFINAVAQETGKTHLRLDLGIFSYTVLEPPPRAVERLERNILVSMTQLSALFRDEAYKARTRRRIEEWTTKHDRFIGRDYLGLYDWLNVVHLQTRILAEDIPYLKSKWFLGYYWESSVDFAANHLNYYVAGRLLWNTRLSLDAILADYYARAYGRAAPRMREYFTAMEDRFASRPVENAGYNPCDLLAWNPPEAIARGYELLKEAEALAENDEVRGRIAYVRIGLEMTDRTISLLRLCRQLSDAGLPVRLARARAKATVGAQAAAAPSRETAVAWVEEANRRSDELFARLETLKDTSACQSGSHVAADGIYRWRATLAGFRRLYADAGTRREVIQLPVAWKFSTDPTNGGETKGWHRPDFDDSSWNEINTDDFWEKQGYDKYDGYAWYRLGGVVIPEQYAGRRCVLRFGAVDESCRVFVNGRPGGSFQFDAARDPDSWKKPLEFDVTALALFGRANHFAVRVHDQGYAGGIWQRVFLLLDAADQTPTGEAVFFEGFEEDDWGRRISATGKNYEVGVAGDAARGGARSLGVKVLGHAPDYCSVATAAIPVEAGAAYCFTAAYRVLRFEANPTPDGKPAAPPLALAVRLIFLDAHGQSCVPAKDYEWVREPYREGNNDWRDLRRVVTAPAGAKSLSITAFFHSKGEYRLDDIRLARW
jgi:hypothetical protein